MGSLDFLQQLFGGSNSGSTNQSTQNSNSNSQSTNSGQNTSSGNSSSTGQNTSNSQSSSVNMTSAGMQGLQNSLSSFLSSLLGGGSSFGQYTGPTAAGMTGNEGSVLNGLMGAADPNGQRGQLLNATMNGAYLNSNPFLNSAITAAQRPTMQNLQETLSQSNPGMFTQNGQFVQPKGTGAFDRAQAIATRGAAQTMGDIATNMSNTQYGNERQLQQGAVGLSQADVNTSIANLQAQSLPRLISQLGIQNGMQTFQNGTQNLLSLLQNIGDSSRTVLGNQSTSSSQGTNSSNSTNSSQGTNSGQSTSSSSGSGQSTGNSNTTSQNGIISSLSQLFKSLFGNGA